MYVNNFTIFKKIFKPEKHFENNKANNLVFNENKQLAALFLLMVLKLISNK